MPVFHSVTPWRGRSPRPAFDAYELQCKGAGLCRAIAEPFKGLDACPHPTVLDYLPRGPDRLPVLSAVAERAVPAGARAGAAGDAEGVGGRVTPTSTPPSFPAPIPAAAPKCRGVDHRARALASPLPTMSTSMLSPSPV